MQRFEMNRWISGLITGNKRWALPVLTTPGIPLIGASPPEVFRSGELQSRVIRLLAERFPMAAALTMMDLSVEAEAFGAPVKFSDLENIHAFFAALDKFNESTA